MVTVLTEAPATAGGTGLPRATRRPTTTFYGG
jgi:hypothetical protein